MLKMESYKVEGTCVLIDDHGVTGFGLLNSMFLGSKAI